jgi:hypothetical protein
VFAPGIIGAIMRGCDEMLDKPMLVKQLQPASRLSL